MNSPNFNKLNLSNFGGILSKIGGILQIEKDALDDWIEDRTEMVIDESSASMFAVAALTISDPEYKYQLLSCSDLKEVFYNLLDFSLKWMFESSVTFKTQKRVV